VLGVMFVSFAIHLKVQPFREDVLDRLETLSMCGSVLTLWIGLFFYLGTPLEVEVVLTIVICIFNALLCAQFALSIVKEFLRARVMNSMPAGSQQDGGVSEDAVSEYIVLFWWCGRHRCAWLNCIARP
jgi:ABC-type thiamin/hydroxymethylpyrimidine transport system permease subunit